MPDKLPDNGNYPDKTTEPWWNDGNKIAGFAATICIAGLAFIFFAVCVRIGMWIWP